MSGQREPSVSELLAEAKEPESGQDRATRAFRDSWERCDREHAAQAGLANRAKRPKRRGDCIAARLSPDLSEKVEAYRQRRARAAGAEIATSEAVRMLIAAGLRAERGS